MRDSQIDSESIACSPLAIALSDVYIIPAFGAQCQTVCLRQLYVLTQYHILENDKILWDSMEFYGILWYDGIAILPY